MTDNDYKELTTIHLNVVKELSQTVEKLAKSLEARYDANEKRHDTCCKYITILVITIALFATIILCCICGKCNNQSMNVKYVPETIKIQVEMPTQPNKVIEIPLEQQ